MDNLLLAYLAGAIDSDGFITIKRHTYGIRTRKDAKNPTYAEWTGIKQTSPEIINLIHLHFGGYKTKEKSAAKNGQPLYSVRLMSKKANAFILAIYPFLRIKKQQAEIALHLRECLSEKKAMEVAASGYNIKAKKKVNYRRYALSEEQVKRREELLIKIRSLNDVRHGPGHKPLPWQNLA